MAEIKISTNLKLTGIPRADVKVHTVEPDANRRSRVIVNVRALDAFDIPALAVSLRLTAAEAREISAALAREADVAERLDAEAEGGAK